MKDDVRRGEISQKRLRKITARLRSRIRRKRWTILDSVKKEAKHCSQEKDEEEEAFQATQCIGDIVFNVQLQEVWPFHFGLEISCC